MLGLVMIVLPGPAFVMIPLGLAILAIEFAWVGKWVRRLTGIIQKKKARIHRPPWRRIAGIHPAYSIQGVNRANKDFPSCGTDWNAFFPGFEVLHCAEASNPLCWDYPSGGTDP
jgi:hypothetical protein